MADQSSNPDSGSGGRPGQDSAAGTPTWVKVSMVIAIVLVALFVAAHLTGLAPEGH